MNFYVTISTALLGSLCFCYWSLLDS